MLEVLRIIIVLNATLTAGLSSLTLWYFFGRNVAKDMRRHVLRVTGTLIGFLAYSAFIAVALSPHDHLAWFRLVGLSVLTSLSTHAQVPLFRYEHRMWRKKA